MDCPRRMPLEIWGDVMIPLPFFQWFLFSDSHHLGPRNYTELLSYNPMLNSKLMRTNTGSSVGSGWDQRLGSMAPSLMNGVLGCPWKLVAS